MKKEIILLVLQILLAISCVVCSIVIDKELISGIYSFCGMLWGMISGMTLKELLIGKK